VRSPRTPGITLSFFALLLVAALFARPHEADARGVGALISAPDGNLFLMYGGTRHPVDSATLAVLGLDERSSHVISQRTLEALAEGTRVPALRNGSLVAGPDGWPYLLLDGLHQIPDEETFYASGWGGYRNFGPTAVLSIDADLLAALPLRAPLEASERVGPGSFDWGYCTWWVAQRRAVTWLGNAVDWYENAQAKGYAVGDLPLPGAILVRQSAYYGGYGHVAYVESADGTSFTVSEMNVNGLGVLSTHTYDLATNPPPGLLGFVYWRFGEEPAATAEPTPTVGPLERP
jgi:hypothetical protein